jgi:hypothetical protein
MRESREKNYKQARTHTYTPSVTVEEKEKRIPNETIRLEIDSEKDLDCMLAFFSLFFLFPYSFCLSDDY